MGSNLKEIYRILIEGGNIYAMNEETIRLRDRDQIPVLKLKFKQFQKVKTTMLKRSKAGFFLIDKKKIWNLHGNSAVKRQYKSFLKSRNKSTCRISAGSEKSGATFSDCRKYRYALWRIWDDAKPKLMFIGLNPSSANEHTNDPTIKSIIRIAKHNGYGGVYMVNCFPFVSTNPDDLRDFGNTVMNDFWLHKANEWSKNVVFAWGSFKVVTDTGRDKELCAMFPNAKALRLNKNGSPMHPLFCSSKTKLINYESSEGKQR